MVLIKKLPSSYHESMRTFIVMTSQETSEKDRIWAEMYEVKNKVRDLEETAKWMARKRDESIHPEDYVHFFKECNKALRDQSDLGYRLNQLHFELVAAMEKSADDAIIDTGAVDSDVHM